MGFLSFFFTKDPLPVDDSRYRQAMQDALSDGHLSDNEARQLAELAAELRLGSTQTNGIAAEAWRNKASSATADEEITEAELDELRILRNALGVEQDTEATYQKLVKARLLTQLTQDGELPTFNTDGFIKKRNELVHWLEPAKYLENKVTHKKWTGGSTGLSIPIVAGIRWRVGGTRGRWVPVEETVVSSSGWLLVTNKRIVFRGNIKSWQYDLDELMEYDFYSDGIRITPNNGSPRIVQFAEADVDTDIIGTIMTRVIDGFARDILGR